MGAGAAWWGTGTAWTGGAGASMEFGRGEALEGTRRGGGANAGLEGLRVRLASAAVASAVAVVGRAALDVGIVASGAAPGALAALPGGFTAPVDALVGSWVASEKAQTAMAASNPNTAINTKIVRRR